MKLREKFDIFAKLISIPEFEVSSCSAGLFKLLCKFPQKSNYNKEYNSNGSCSESVTEVPLWELGKEPSRHRVVIPASQPM
jgi:hypothetical protein